jgi:hypothetical protein
MCGGSTFVVLVYRSNVPSSESRTLLYDLMCPQTQSLLHKANSSQVMVGDPSRACQVDVAGEGVASSMKPSLEG